MSTGAKPSFSWVNPRAHGPGAVRRRPLRSTARTIRGTTGARTITAATAPLITPHPDAPRITFPEPPRAPPRRPDPRDRHLTRENVC